jgi:hypothetical protein
MGIFKTMRERLALEREWLPKIHAELAKLNERHSQQAHDVLASYKDLHLDLKGLAAAETNFIEVIRHFFAIERALKDAEAKRREKEDQDLAAGKHDDLF